MSSQIPNNLTVFTGSYSDLCKYVHEKKCLCVCDFFATWCGPCRKFGVVLQDIAKEHPDVIFVKVDIDANASLTDHYGVKSVPTIKYFKASSETELVELSSDSLTNKTAVKAKIEQYK